MANNRLLYLDGWRGLAIILLLLGHFFPIDGFGASRFGVELFFVLSGRLMAEILFVQDYPLVQFYKRRIARIFPALFAYVLITWICTMGMELAFGPKAAISALAFIYNYNDWIPGMYRTGALDHVWSLCVEEHCYIMLGLLAWAARRYHIRVSPLIACMALMSMAVGIYGYSLGMTYQEAYWRTDSHLYSIFLGGCMYLWTRHYALPAWVSIASAIVAVILAMDCLPPSVRFGFSTIFLAYAVASLDNAPNWYRRALTLKPLTYAGVVSYSLYLWQQPFAKLADNHNPAGMLMMGLVCGLASFYLLERPARHYLNKHW